LRGLALGLGWEVSGRMGALAATYCLEKSGTQNHVYTVSEFVSRFRKVFDDQGKLNVLLK
jgi:adenosine kinase